MRPPFVAATSAQVVFRANMVVHGKFSEFREFAASDDLDTATTVASLVLN
jgi:hypothetical protein